MQDEHWQLEPYTGGVAYQHEEPLTEKRRVCVMVFVPGTHQKLKELTTYSPIAHM